MSVNYIIIYPNLYWTKLIYFQFIDLEFIHHPFYKLTLASVLLLSNKGKCNIHT